MFDYSMQPGRALLSRPMNKNASPLISIVTAFFNAGKYFEQTFCCVMNQTFPWFEWIIVDDGSTDAGAVELLQTLVKNDPRIRTLRKENEGIAAARNIGILSSRSDIFVPLDADDLIEPNFLEYVYWLLRFNPRASWAYTDSVGFGTQQYLWHPYFSYKIMKRNNQLTCTAAIRKTSFEDIGLYARLGKHYNEDWYAWLCMMAKGYYPAHACGVYQFWYRRSNSGVLSITHNDKRYFHKARVQIRKAARTVHKPIFAAEYPNYAVMAEPMGNPSVISFGIKAYVSSALRIAWLQDTLPNSPHEDMGHVILGLAESGVSIHMLMTAPQHDQESQWLEQKIDGLVYLPSFVPFGKEAEYLSYYLSSRDINIVIVNRSELANHLSPWVRANFPNVVLFTWGGNWSNGVYDAKLAPSSTAQTIIDLAQKHTLKGTDRIAASTWWQAHLPLAESILIKYYEALKSKAYANHGYAQYHKLMNSRWSRRLLILLGKVFRS